MGEAWGIEKYANVIKQKAQFLEQKGFMLSGIDEYTIVYAHKRKAIKVDIYWGRYTDFPEVGVRFKRSSGSWEHYGLNWFLTLRRFETGERFESIIKNFPPGNEKDTLNNILQLLEFLDENLINLTDINYCRKAGKKINNLIESGIFSIKNRE